MSTTGKKPARKDKDFGIGDFFGQNAEKKAELAKNDELEAENKEKVIISKESVPKKQEKSSEKPEKGRGDRKNTSTVKLGTASALFAKEKKKRYQQKSVYLSVENVEFIQAQSVANGIAFSEVLNRIIDNFTENM